MKQLFTIWFLFLSLACTAQSFPKKYVDSLTAIALSKKNNKPTVLNRDSVLQLLWESPSIDDRISMYYDITYNYFITKERSGYYSKLILENAQKSGDKVLEAVVMAELGYGISTSNTVKGLTMVYESLKKAEATGNARAIGIAYNNLGQCYPNNLKLSKEYYLKGLEYSRKGDDHLITCIDLMSLGTIYIKENKKNSALACYMESYRLAVEKNVEYGIAMGLYNLSKLDDTKNSLHYYRQINLMPFSVRNAFMQYTTNFATANYYLGKKRFDSAFYFITWVRAYAKTHSLQNQIGALFLTYTYFKEIQKPDSALSYLTSYYNLKDSLYGTKVTEQAQDMAYADMQRQKELETQKAAFQNRLILYAVSAVAILLMGLAFVFWRSKQMEQQAKKIVQEQKDQIEQTLDQLKATQSQLIQSEKMASLGELTAGIAHEIQNPLNFVNNFSEVNTELIDELQQELKTGNTEEAIAISNDIKENEQKINHHGKRADAIVKGMLQHSRSSSAVKEPTNINSLADEYLRLAYHGLRAKDKSFNATMVTDYDDSIGMINVIPQDIGRVILNLITNAFYVVDEKKKQSGDNYEPAVSVSTKKANDKIEICVKDNGNGIPLKVLDKIFQPFFTTKPTGQGTGLGLSLSYDIVKAHGGKLTVKTKETQGSEFMIQLPI